jgi:hypothetical protein
MYLNFYTLIFEGSIVMEIKRWLQIWFVLVGFTLCFIAGFNYKIDSLGLSDQQGYLDNAAKDLANGKIVAGLQNFDERLFRKKIIQNLSDEPQWVAIGSSRTMQLRKEIFNDVNVHFQNYSVSGASLEDYIILLFIHSNKFGHLPENVIIGIDPWVFNKYSGQNRYLSLSDDYQKSLEIMGAKESKVSKNVDIFNKFFSLEYTKENVKFIMNNYKNNLKGYYVVDTTNIDELLREPDGSIRYKFSDRYPNFENVKEKAINYTRGDIYSLEKFEKMSNIELFEKFIEYLKTKNVNIYFYLPPYNPIVYDALVENKNYIIIKNVENYLHDFAQKQQIKIIGSYNPHLYGLTNENFFDGMHSLDNAYDIIFKDLRKNFSE